MSKSVTEILHYDPDETYARGLTPFQAVVMAAQEARFINEKARLRLFELGGRKASTVALDRLREGKLEVISNAED